MNAYTPRRCSKRWLDADCPTEVLFIMDHGPKESDRFDVFYAEPSAGTDYRDMWLTFLCSTEHGAAYHGEMEAYKVAQYRYRKKHRYATWSSLPDAVKNAVRADLIIHGHDA